MAQHIDQDRPVTIYGSITRDLSRMPDDPMHDIATKLYREEGNPAFLRLADPVEEARVEIPAKAFLEWLENAGLVEEFLHDLQGMAQTDKGEPLLTSWASWNRFWAAISDHEGGVVETIRPQVQGWMSLGLDEVYFDFYAGPPPAPTKEALLDALTRIRDLDHAEGCEYKDIPLDHCGCQPSPREIAIEVIGPRWPH